MQSAGITSYFLNQTNVTLPMTRHPFLLPSDPDGVLQDIFGSKQRRDDFFANELGVDALQVDHSSSSTESSTIPSLDLRLLYGSSRLTKRSEGGHDDFPKEFSFEQFEAYLHEGGSATAEISIYNSEIETNPLLPWKNKLEKALGQPLSMNIYMSGPSGSALKPHSDRYDVFIVQLAGAKDWELCFFTSDLYKTDADWGNYNDAVRALELKQTAGLGALGALKNQQKDRRVGQRCRMITMKKGDILYMPKGVVHSARTNPSYLTSIHAAVGLLHGMGTTQRGKWQYINLLESFGKILKTSFVGDAWVTTNITMGDAFQKWIEEIVERPDGVGLKWRRTMPAHIWRYYEACHLSKCHTEMQQQHHAEAKEFLVANLESMLVAVEDHALVQRNSWIFQVLLRQAKQWCIDALDKHLESVTMEALDRDEREADVKIQEMLKKFEKYLFK